jgi:hypothetical protein
MPAIMMDHLPGLKSFPLGQQVRGQVFHVFQNPGDSGIGDLVIHKEAVSLHLHQEGPSKLLQVMGDQGLGQTQFFDNAGDGLLAIIDAEQNPQPILVRQAPGHKGHRLEIVL